MSLPILPQVETQSGRYLIERCNRINKIVQAIETYDSIVVQVVLHVHALTLDMVLQPVLMCTTAELLSSVASAMVFG